MTAGSITPEYKAEFSLAFKSKVFEILVGPSAEPLFAHANILSRSRVLRQVVKGPWKEKSERKIFWPDWSVNAADKFLEWLYTDDYTCPYPTEAAESEAGSLSEDELIVPRRSVRFSSDIDNMPVSDANPREPIPEVPPPVEDSERYASTEEPASEPSADVEAFPTLLSLKDLDWFGCRELGKISQAEEYEKWTGQMLWTPAELDYGATFTTHAEVYVMACQYMVDGLKNMAWQRLRSVLISIGTPQTGSPVVGNLVALIHHVYRKTGPYDADENEEPLRELLSTFMALHFTQLKESDFGDLLRHGADTDGEFVVDLLTKMVPRIQNLEARVPPDSREPSSSHDRINSSKKKKVKKYKRLSVVEVD
ncbi:MAG: hypothetical protein Q9202_003893 [Teloschistes flavicans]